MTKNESLRIVLDLARQNVIDREDDPDEYRRQVEAIDMLAGRIETDGDMLASCIQGDIVYCVFRDDVDSVNLDRVFSEREKADKYVADNPGSYYGGWRNVEEWDVE